MTKILYLSYDGMTDSLGQSQVIPYLSGLSKEGYAITLISFEKKQKLSQKKAINNQLIAAGIDWLPFTYSKFPPVLSTIYDLLRLYVRVFQLHEKIQFNIVHCRSYLTALIGLSLKKRKNVSFLFDMRGFWADERVEGGIWDLRNPIYKWIYDWFKRKEVTLISQADHIISLTHKGKAAIENGSLFSQNSNKSTISIQVPPITVIPCCVDTELFDPQQFTEVEIEKTKNELSLHQLKTIWGYLGSVGTWYELDEMLLTWKKWHQHHINSIFLWITHDSPQLILETAEKHQVPIASLKIIKAKREQVPQYLSIVDIGIFFVKPLFSKTASSPTKQGEFMSMGIPVIMKSGIGDSDDIVRKWSSGLLLNSWDQEIKIDNINKQLIRDGACDYFSLEKGIMSYHTVYRLLLSQKQ